jgi:hypothetical protein
VPFGYASALKTGYRNMQKITHQKFSLQMQELRICPQQKAKNKKVTFINAS